MEAKHEDELNIITNAAADAYREYLKNPTSNYQAELEREAELARIALLSKGLGSTYAITWTSPKEQVFELPTGGTSVMRQGENLLFLPTKQQCVALAKQALLPKRIGNYKIYEVSPDGNPILVFS